ncbi:hypothetical protein G7Y89_g2859 [Cudoniella acicularis]|uniref:Phytoene desaturase n=1 Tax=Cudoniella acicularis TaxID=354080 RepID=A0A8H4RSL8_9HELO|nr:hypothetical protein G7Y89_g2859 [Cudoniella acicularis]
MRFLRPVLFLIDKRHECNGNRVEMVDVVANINPPRHHPCLRGPTKGHWARARDRGVEYSFCRVADYLIDNASSQPIAREWIKKLTHYFDLARIVSKEPNLYSYIEDNFPESSQSTLQLLPTQLLPFGPLYCMNCSKVSRPTSIFMILRMKPPISPSKPSMTWKHMYVNIARDISTGAVIGRAYFPTTWLKEEGLTPNDVLDRPDGPEIETLRMRLLAKAFGVYKEAQVAILQLPADARAAMRVAVESYMEIGRVLRVKGYKVKKGKATVPKLRRLKVAWKALSAGLGGIATAARLAKAGFSVTVLEKNTFTGGRCSIISHNGHRFDQGPSLLLLPKLFSETFHDLSTSLSAEGVQLLKCEPNYNLWFGDGERFELSSDTAVMKREIERWEGKEGFERYLSWLKEAHRHYEISAREVLHKNFATVFNLLRPSFLVHLFRLHPFESIYARAAKYFWTERLRRVFTFGSMYMGMSPFDAPGTYSLLQYTELAEGIWYPVGGFHAVVAALVKICERLGVDIRLNTPVSSILTTPDGKTATGALTSSGETLTADVVIINADLVYAYNNLFPVSTSASTKSYASSLSKRAGSCSSISFYWSLSQKIPELTTHNIFLADEYRESFDAIFDRQSIPHEPSFYVNVPSRIDPTAAPKGKDTLVVLVPVGHLKSSSTTSTQKGLPPSSELDWPSLINSTRTTILNTIQTRTNCASLSPLITNEITNDPQTWESKFNLDKGSILGLSHSFFNVLAFRPSTRAKGIKNCYFVGASTHPGTGVPIVLAGVKITAEQILSDLHCSIPWSSVPFEEVARDQGVKQGKGTRDSCGFGNCADVC